jgi:hypothetical protein
MSIIQYGTKGAGNTTTLHGCMSEPSPQILTTCCRKSRRSPSKVTT